jgi:hypothetical protein
MDLLTGLEYELGPVLGYEHSDTGVMLDTLATGTRRVPSAGSDWFDGAVFDGVFAVSQAKLAEQFLAGPVSRPR